ncbi:MAG TPA: bifunctional DNA-formamidopyrimidine glycosylase/DNA-(apurinic or apyrimidinic site) lyase [Acidobacteriaceae bacterium]|jgi:formamidopyrimidine-DNA glycosylase|nr:bifunctional DNA-formamidopyrimidine glycosylase/DNA-(apurinic or apyrimidinic site) lyase [Acidobacteriaceae bacterium]
MPELPEVETVANGVDARIRGDYIEEVWFSSKREPMNTPPAAMAKALTGRTIERVRRVGKHIVFDFAPDAKSDPVQWIVHLGMTGRLLVADPAVPRPLHTHGVLVLRSGRELRFVDARRFGRMGIYLVEDTKEEAADLRGFQGPGTEPLRISRADFRKLFHGRRTSIKAALLNQSLLHGVGNIYADESLFRAKIRPRRMASRLTTRELDRLHGAVQTVLREAIRLGGSSVSDYVDAAGERGFFQLRHYVYMRTSQPCLVCGTAIRRTVVAGRGTHYCPVCQR